MGLESAVYKYVLRSNASEPARRALLDLGAEPIDRDRLVLRGPQHWVDVEFQDATISLRIAFSNPPEAFDVLRNVVDTFINVAPGELHEFGTERRLQTTTDVEWKPIVQAFRRRRAEFQANYGEFIAHISADEVFQALRRRSA